MYGALLDQFLLEVGVHQAVGGVVVRPKVEVRPRFMDELCGLIRGRHGPGEICISFGNRIGLIE